ncbi:HAD hydrolase [Prochlorococcus sp. SS52]|nr:HAD hydrolase [Prochlorococcus marinus str. LG]KGG21168.1 HAD hydrolase [Prochlorococcus marinus str. SS2]KGG23992.1 HAD hydrolase [Prochlorococcus marinus str. SS35]KGG31749.1 HAD hydrolase [Prochlorococcus marinus str. SS51]KGG34815.1 HAD hydrolase [Prochlorococcus sp. SS52]
MVFDFDGVIVDGLLEYWDSSRKAFLKIQGALDTDDQLPLEMPHEFRQLRPWVKNGWEMVLLTAELIRKDSPLSMHGAFHFANEYHKNCHTALKTWGWEPKQLQNALDNIRKETIKTDKKKWLASHKLFPNIAERIHQLENESVDFGVLTTKSAEFTSELLNHFNLHPNFLYGHESGQKTTVLLQISKDHSVRGFIEDRRATLETVLNTPGISSIPCYLADWGYLKPDDRKDLPSDIHLLKPEKLMSPLANWP